MAISLTWNFALLAIDQDLADQTHADADKLCREKLLMSSCLDDARKARQEAERAIRRVELEAV